MNLALIGVALSELFSTDPALYIGVVSNWCFLLKSEYSALSFHSFVKLSCRQTLWLSRIYERQPMCLDTIRSTLKKNQNYEANMKFYLHLDENLLCCKLRLSRKQICAVTLRIILFWFEFSDCFFIFHRHFTFVANGCGYVACKKYEDRTFQSCE